MSGLIQKICIRRNSPVVSFFQNSFLRKKFQIKSNNQDNYNQILTKVFSSINQGVKVSFSEKGVEEFFKNLLIIKGSIERRIKLNSFVDISLREDIEYLSDESKGKSINFFIQSQSCSFFILLNESREKIPKFSLNLFAETKIGRNKQEINCRFEFNQEDLFNKFYRFCIDMERYEKLDLIIKQRLLDAKSSLSQLKEINLNKDINKNNECLASR